jgi:hypothetical protein
MQTFLQDLRFGFRMLRRSPGFSILALLCLTLGMGSNAAVSSGIEGILFGPYPAVAHQAENVRLHRHHPPCIENEPHNSQDSISLR